MDEDLTTIMTVGKIANRLDSLPKPDLIITDETHHSLAKTYRKVYDYYPDVPRLGFTATPWRMSGQGFTDIYDEMVEGPTVKWLIDNQFLAPYEYYSVNLIDNSKLKRSSTGDFTNNSMDNAMSRVIYGDVVKTYQEKANGRKAILYAHRIGYSQSIAQEFNDNGIVARHCDATTPASERKEIMDGFKNGDIQVLCNVDLISEGFNVPDCSCVIMMRPTKSLVLDVQQSMRSMRYQPNKTAIIIDHVGNYMETADDVPFGLPDMPRNWSLDSWKKPGKKNKNEVSVTTCPNCFAVVLGNPRICPVCGEELETGHGDDLENDKSASIERITAEFHITVDHDIAKYGRMNPQQAKSYEDLKGIQKARGYKPGWVYFQAKQRGWLKQTGGK